MTALGFGERIAANDAPVVASSRHGERRGEVGHRQRAPASPSSGAAQGGDTHVTITTPIVVHANDAEGGAAAGEAAAPAIQQAHRDAATSYWRDWKEAG